jgi:hypothetical protein
MKIIKDLRLLIGLLTFIVIVSITTDTKANPYYDPAQLTLRQVPIYCGDTAFMFETSLDLFNELPIAGADVRTSGTPEGEVLGIITISYNFIRNSGSILMTVPETGETCVLAYGQNWQFFPDYPQQTQGNNETE